MNAPPPGALLPVTLADLAQVPRWVAWQEEDRPNGTRTKVPYGPDGRKARADAPSTWGTRDAAERRASRLPKPYGLGGIGIELGSADDGRWLAGVDLDTCRDLKTGRVERWALDVAERLGSYAEVSPSGTGLKSFVQLDPADVPALRAAMGTEHGRQFKRGGSEHPPAIELHISNRFFATTDDLLTGMPGDLRPVSLDLLLWLVREAGPAFVGGNKNNSDGGKGGQDSDDLSARIGRAASFNSTLARRWAGDWTGLNDASASGCAMALGAALRRAGFSFEDMCQALHIHRDTRDWASTKGKANEGRELRRVWDAAGRDGAEKRAAGTNAGRDDPWPTPNLVLAAQAPLPPPTLPLVDVFPPRCAEWIMQAADAAGAKPDYVALAFLAGAGAAIGNARWGQPKEGWAEPPVINAALIGPPSAQKSPSLDQVAGPLLTVEQDANADWSERKRDWQTEKAAAVECRDLWQRDVKEAVKLGNAPPRMPVEAEEPAPPQRRRLVSTDPTTEKAGRLSAANPRGVLLVRDELAGWVAGMDRYGAGGGGADRAFWLQAYGGRPWSPDRVKDGDAEVSVPHLAWGIVGGIQPDRLASLLLAGDDDGLAARFLYTWPEPQRPRWTEAAGGLDRGRVWFARLHELPWQPPEPVRLPFSRDAQAELQRWREEAAGMEDGAAGLFLSWLGKLPGFAVRLAVVFEHLSWLERDGADPPEQINASAVLRAVGFLADYAVPMARRAFGEAALPEAERDARVLARWLLRQHPRPAVLNVRELRRMAGGPGIATPARVEAALGELEALGWVRSSPARDGAPGRARNDWTVNPAIVEGGDGMA